MHWTIAVTLVVIWALGLAAHVGGGLIHLLPIIAAGLFIFNMLSARRAATENYRSVWIRRRAEFGNER